MGIADYSEFDGLGLAGLVARGEVSPAELVEEAIAERVRASLLAQRVGSQVIPRGRGVLGV